MPFKPGESGNPKGKPRGAYHRTTVLVAELLENSLREVVEKMLDEAKKGDMAAIRMVLERVLPPRRSRPVAFDLPADGNGVTLINAIFERVAAGEIAPEEAAGLVALIEAKRKAVEHEELAQRIAAIEKTINHR